MLDSRIEGKKILVTGGAGFIGSHFVDYLLHTYENIQIITVDKLGYAGSLDHLEQAMDDERHHFVHGNILDPETLQDESFDVHWIVHFAAETHVDRSILSPEPFILTDIIGTFRVLERARKMKTLKGFIHISTDEVYGDILEGYAHEEAPFNPSSPYSASKAGADHLARSYVRTYGLPVIIVRPCNAYGPRQFPEKLIPFFIMRAFEGKSLPLYGSGENVRDWIFVRDLAEAIGVIMEKGEFGQAYNIGAHDFHSNKEIAHLIVELTGASENLIEFVADRPGHDFRYALDTTRLHQLGWHPKTAFRQGMTETVQWYKENEKIWRKQLSRHADTAEYFKANYQARVTDTPLPGQVHE